MASTYTMVVNKVGQGIVSLWSESFDPKRYCLMHQNGSRKLKTPNLLTLKWTLQIISSNFNIIHII